jgi:hypothetical protein
LFQQWGRREKDAHLLQGEHQQHAGGELSSALLAYNLLERAIDMEGSDVYRTTERGMKFIECCEETRSLIGLVINNRRIDPMSDFYVFDSR